MSEPSLLGAVMVSEGMRKTIPCEAQSRVKGLSRKQGDRGGFGDRLRTGRRERELDADLELAALGLGDGRAAGRGRLDRELDGPGLRRGRADAGDERGRLLLRRGARA